MRTQSVASNAGDADTSSAIWATVVNTKHSGSFAFISSFTTAVVITVTVAAVICAA